MMNRKTLRETAFLMVLMAGCSGQMSDPATESGGEDLERVSSAQVAEQLPASPQAEEAAPESLDAVSGVAPMAEDELADGQKIAITEPEMVQAETQATQEQVEPSDELAMLQAGVEPAAAPAEVGQEAAEADASQQEAKADPEPGKQMDEADAILVATDTGLSVNELLFSRSIADRQPLEPTHEFSAEDDGRIYCYLNMKNATEEQQSITVHWLDQKGERIDGHSTQLDVGLSQTWRTWAFSSAFADPGVYGVEIEDQNGDVLATGHFELKAAG